MSIFQIETIESAPKGPKTRLEKPQQTFGTVPNIAGMEARPCPDDSVSDVAVSVQLPAPNRSLSRQIAMFSRNLHLNAGSRPFEDVDLTGPF
jgi:hypothetical protein